MLERGDGVGRLAGLADGDDQGARIGHAVAVAVLAGDLDLRRDLGNGFQPVLGRRARVVAGAAGQNQHAVDLAEHGFGIGTKQRGRDRLDTFERVGDGARLLEDFLLHVVAIRAELDGAAVRGDGAHRSVGGVHAHVLAGTGRDVLDPVAARLQVHHVAFFQIDDLVGHAGQGHGVGRQEALAAVGAAHAHHQGRAVARTDDALRLVAVEGGDGVGAGQALRGGLDSGKQVAVIEVVDQVGDDLGVGLAQEDVALGLQLAAQLFVVLDDAVVHHGQATGLGGGGVGTGAVGEVRVGVVHRGRAVRGPAGVGDAQSAGDAVRRGLRFELGHALGAARAAQLAVLQHGHAAGVITAVLEALEAFDKNRRDVARPDGADDATHA